MAGLLLSVRSAWFRRADGLFGLLEEASAEVSREHLDGSEECAAADPPLAGVAVEACIRDDAVQVRMELEALVPGMEDGGAADADAEAPGVGGDGGEGLGGGAEQDREQDAPVLEGDPGDGRRQGEDDMEVRYRQDTGGLRLHPAPRGIPLAGGAMPVAAGMEGDVVATALCAAVELAPQRGGSAALDGRHDPRRDGVEDAVAQAPEGGPGACHYRTVDAEIIGQFRGAFRPFSSVGVRQCLA